MCNNHEFFYEYDDKQIPPFTLVTVLEAAIKYVCTEGGRAKAYAYV